MTAYPWTKRVMTFSCDLLVKLRFGLDAPVKHQLLFVPTAEVRFCYPPGQTLKLFYPAAPFSVFEVTRGVERADISLAGGGTLNIIGKKIKGNLHWDDAGEFSRMRGKNQKINKSRFVVLDEIIKEVSQTGLLRPSRDIDPRAFRNLGGITIRIDSDGEVVLVGGRHRFGICLAFNLGFCPMTVDGVHPDAIQSGRWGQLLVDSAALEWEHESRKQN